MMCPLGLRRAALSLPPTPPTKTILMGSDVHLHLACLIDVNTAHLEARSFPPSALSPPSLSSNSRVQR